MVFVTSFMPCHKNEASIILNTDHYVVAHDVRDINKQDGLHIIAKITRNTSQEMCTQFVICCVLLRFNIATKKTLVIQIMLLAFSQCCIAGMPFLLLLPHYGLLAPYDNRDIFQHWLS